LLPDSCREWIDLREPLGCGGRAIASATTWFDVLGLEGTKLVSFSTYKVSWAGCAEATLIDYVGWTETHLRDVDVLSSADCG
jgi:hypothetical protein